MASLFFDIFGRRLSIRSYRSEAVGVSRDLPEVVCQKDGGAVLPTAGQEVRPVYGRL